MLRSLVCLLLVASAHAASPLLTVAEWVTLDYDWQAMNESRLAWLDAGSFIPENCALAGVKYWRGRYFVTVPRWRPGVPSTLNELAFNGDATSAPLLRPFPSLAANTPSLGGFSYVQSMEIDPLGRMWVIDAGSQNFFGGDVVIGAPRLVVLDLAAGTTLIDYTFPADVALNGTYTFLNDIVVDWRGNWAYISVSNEQGGIIAFDASSLTSRRMTSQYTQADPAYDKVTYCSGGPTFVSSPGTASDGIALSADAATLYWCPLNGVDLYAIATAALQDWSLSADQLQASTVLVGQKQGLSDGLAMTSADTLYYGSLDGCLLNVWPSDAPLLPHTQGVVAQNNQLLNWIDTFAFDDSGNLIFTTNRLDLYFNDAMDFTGYSGANFRLMSVYLNVSSYMV